VPKNLNWNKSQNSLRFFLAGDIMTGRTIDQMFQTHNSEKFCQAHNVPIKQYRAWSKLKYGEEFSPVQHDYIWGTAIDFINHANVDFRLANLEMAITNSDDCFPKEVNFRMHPANIGCLSAINLDCCVLANNHSLDFGLEGLIDTVNTLSAEGIGYAGAGLDNKSSTKPYIHYLTNGVRIVVHSWGVKDSHIPSEWESTESTFGINYLNDYSEKNITRLINIINTFRQNNDITILSIHWGRNWVQKIPHDHRRVARLLINEAGVDILHGHSSHHPIGIEQYKGKLILYGCGDLINDLEGHPKYQLFRPNLGLLYFVDLDIKTKQLLKLNIVPIQRRRFRLEKPSDDDFTWIISSIKQYKN
jgi:poly-gamma-glutamate synthesis protein (capsule biosynthesis protein)